MRHAFVSALIDLAARDERVLLLTADLGFSVLEPFRERFPSRFWNVGVAEANLVGIATGLAADGYVPFTYTMAAFALPRAFEMVRNGPVAHGLNVRLVGVGGGFDYGVNGASHHAFDDLALARALGELDVFVPMDATQASAATHATADRRGPVYLRLGTEPRTWPAAETAAFVPGRLTVLKAKPSADVAIVALGPTALDALDAARELEAAGLGVQVLGVACVRPAPVEDLVRASRGVRLVITVENHGLEGGIGSLVAEVLAVARVSVPLLKLGVGVRDLAPGSPDYMRRALGLDGGSIARRVATELRRM